MLVCPRCDSTGSGLQKRGIRSGKQQYQCQNCGKWFRDESSTVSEDVPSSSSYFKESGDKGEIGFKTHTRISSLDELVEYCSIDLNTWDIERWVCNKWEMGAKDYNKNLKIEPLFQIKVWLRKKTVEIRATNNIKAQIEDAAKFAHKYPKVDYKKYKNGLMYEVNLPDLHFGRLTWAEESGEDFDVAIANKVANDVVERLLNYTQSFDVSRILIPLGNDFFNVNNKQETTVHGTPQQEDTRWQKTFRLGRELSVQIVDKCSAIAPVDILIVPGNHDEEKMFCLGDSLESWYHSNPNVRVNNAAMKRKYYGFGNTLIGFTHGYYEKTNKLPMLMALEVPEMWARSQFREFHVGDKHHLKELQFMANEEDGVVIRYMRALAAVDAWTFDKGFVGAQRAATSFLWHPTDGLLAQFSATVK